MPTKFCLAINQFKCSLKTSAQGAKIGVKCAMRTFFSPRPRSDNAYSLEQI